MQKEKEIIIEEVLYKDVASFSHSSHIILPKRYEGREVYILLVGKNRFLPLFHKNRQKKIDGKTYVQAEVSDSAGTHSVWIEKEQMKEMLKDKL